ncbi:hypothetical protein WUBG_18889 [Wuchereria bancrofti]|uniref:Uncharacterized protein n=1 Tax=Wuchereria bancrofti TaxID=6293 RepID=J9DL56_WUCBA|nr:hypothetical protein WUBG_18889 [Wuchereria bancrofti]
MDGSCGVFVTFLPLPYACHLHSYQDRGLTHYGLFLSSKVPMGSGC